MPSSRCGYVCSEKWAPQRLGFVFVSWMPWYVDEILTVHDTSWRAAPPANAAPAAGSLARQVFKARLVVLIRRRLWLLWWPCLQIGSASGGEMVCSLVLIWGVAGTLKKKIQ